MSPKGSFIQAKAGILTCTNSWQEKSSLPLSHKNNCKFGGCRDQNRLASRNELSLLIVWSHSDAACTICP